MSPHSSFCTATSSRQKCPFPPATPTEAAAKLLYVCQPALVWNGISMVLNWYYSPLLWVRLTIFSKIWSFIFSMHSCLLCFFSPNTMLVFLISRNSLYGRVTSPLWSYGSKYFPTPNLSIIFWLCFLYSFAISYFTFFWSNLSIFCYFFWILSHIIVIVCLFSFFLQS